jgi:bifunctional DNA-binding transcriptional regulator/antitoxin component of YhaV-PrlF toxin-antitoxin module
MRISASGQVTIPEAIRRQAGLAPHAEIEIDYDGESIRIVPRASLHQGPPTPLLSPEEIRALLGAA